jgi:hypothetical protein
MARCDAKVGTKRNVCHLINVLSKNLFMKYQLLARVAALATFSICLLSFVAYKGNGEEFPYSILSIDTLPKFLNPYDTSVFKGRYIQLRDSLGDYKQLYMPDRDSSLMRVGLPQREVVMVMKLRRRMMSSSKMGIMFERWEESRVEIVPFYANVNLSFVNLADTLSLPDTIWFHR